MLMHARNVLTLILAQVLVDGKTFQTNLDAFDTVENLQGGQAQKVVESGGYNTSELNTLHAGPSL